LGSVYLSKLEESMLRGDFGYPVARAMEFIVKVGEIMGAKALLDIETAHVSGVSYFTIGDPGLEFLEDLSNSGARFRVFTTINPAGFDVVRSIPGLDDHFMERQRRIIEAFRRMGASLWLTCAPYEYLKVRSGTYHAWAESNAVAYINAMHDAWSDKLPGPFAVLASIAGKVPAYGLYTLEGRVPTHIVRVRVKVMTTLMGGILGRVMSRLVSGRPYVEGLRGIRSIIKQLLSSFATYSPNPHMVIDGVTPNYKQYRNLMDRAEVVDIEEGDLEVRPFSGNVDAVYMGCPQASMDEVMEIIEYVRSRNWARARIPVYVGTTPFVLKALGDDLVRRLDEANIHLITTTCPVVSPFMKNLGTARIATDSVKQAYYLPRMVGISYTECNGIECLEGAYQ